VSDAALFPPTPRERIASVALFVTEERKHREHMAWKYPEKRDYWAQRIANCDEALAHLAALDEAVGG
jgi:hypothetical protein